MPRDYSKKGCQQCKSRKKKCDEDKPACSACVRLGLSCSYERTSPVKCLSSNGSVEPRMDAFRPTQRDCEDLVEIEGNVIRGLPDCVLNFFSPTSDCHARDLQIMWQLAAGNDLLRNAVVAFYSAILDGSAAMERLNWKSYGKALSALRSRSFGSHSFADTLEHWTILVSILGSDKMKKLSREHLLPRSECMLVYESLLYHVGTHAIFSRRTKRAWQLWQAHETYQSICDFNPGGPGRMAGSPLLCGRYMLYNLAFELSYLLQSRDHISSDTADRMEALVRQQDGQLEHDFAHSGPVATNAAKHEAECSIYHLFCNSLLICITALREASSTQRGQMERVAYLGMTKFLELPVYGDIPSLAQHAGHFLLAAIWPIQIQGCASYDLADHQTFMKHYSRLERYVDAGHQRRASALLANVGKALEESKTRGRKGAGAQANERPLPAGVMLLRNGGGTPVLEEQTTNSDMTSNSGGLSGSLQ